MVNAFVTLLNLVSSDGIIAPAGKMKKQDPDEVPLEIVKPKEGKKGDDDEDDSKPNGQFSLEW